MKNFLHSYDNLKLPIGLFFLSLILSLLPFHQKQYFSTSTQNIELVDELKPIHYSTFSLQKIFSKDPTSPSLLFAFQKEILQLLVQEKINISISEKTNKEENFSIQSLSYFSIFYFKNSPEDHTNLG